MSEGQQRLFLAFFGIFCFPLALAQDQHRATWADGACERMALPIQTDRFHFSTGSELITVESLRAFDHLKASADLQLSVNQVDPETKRPLTFATDLFERVNSRFTFTDRNGSHLIRGNVEKMTMPFVAQTQQEHVTVMYKTSFQIYPRLMPSEDRFILIRFGVWRGEGEGKKLVGVVSFYRDLDLDAETFRVHDRPKKDTKPVWMNVMLERAAVPDLLQSLLRESAIYALDLFHADVVVVPAHLSEDVPRQEYLAAELLSRLPFPALFNPLGESGDELFVLRRLNKED